MKYKCKECGTEVDSNRIIGAEDYFKMGLCIDCNEFRKITKNPAENSYLFIDGTCFHVGTAKKTVSIRGYGGQVIKIKLKCCGFVFETDNLWNCGKVPECFKDRLPDNAEFIT